MVDRVVIENFKSIEKADIELGRFNVLIGENGSGKSNVLEALAVGAAASADRLEHEFLASRGIRWAPGFMRPAFLGKPTGPILVRFWQKGKFIDFTSKPNENYSAGGWERADLGVGTDEVDRIDLAKTVQKEADKLIRAYFLDKGIAEIQPAILDAVRETISAKKFLSVLNWDEANLASLSDFLIYSPENSALRTFQDEDQIRPLGIRGEGLFSYLKTLATTEEGTDLISKISHDLKVIGWFDGFTIPDNLAPGERRIEIVDRFFKETAQRFDQRTANEGFLLLLFYFTLLRSDKTPKFLAIDNVDASLNPKLCTEMTKKLVQLAKENNRQIIVTTHNPAILDGLDLNDDSQRLMVVSRNSEGHTRVTRVKAPNTSRKGRMRLSEAFTRGMIGGLPKGF